MAVVRSEEAYRDHAPPARSPRHGPCARGTPASSMRGAQGRTPRQPQCSQSSSPSPGGLRDPRGPNRVLLQLAPFPDPWAIPAWHESRPRPHTCRHDPPHVLATPLQRMPTGRCSPYRRTGVSTQTPGSGRLQFGANVADCSSSSPLGQYDDPWYEQYGSGPNRTLARDELILTLDLPHRLPHRDFPHTQPRSHTWTDRTA